MILPLPTTSQQEIDTYAHLLPEGDTWKARLLTQVPDAAQRAHELLQLNAAVHQIYLDVAGHERLYTQMNHDQPARHLQRLSDVHFCISHSALHHAQRYGRTPRSRWAALIRSTNGANRYRWRCACACIKTCISLIYRASPASNAFQYASVNNLNVGRSPEEVLSVLDGLQTGGLCPANRPLARATL